jgi:hypothetical protein
VDAFNQSYCRDDAITYFHPSRLSGDAAATKIPISIRVALTGRF